MDPGAPSEAMAVSREDLARIAEIEFSDIVDSTEMMETKLCIILTDSGFVDVWLSRKLASRFDFHGNIRLPVVPSDWLFSV